MVNMNGGADQFPVEWHELYVRTKMLCSIYHVNFNLSNERVIHLKNGTEANGYFDATNNGQPTLAVACGQPQENWLITFLHESCHMDQWIEKTKEWNDCIVADNVESLDLVDLWLDRKIELSPRQLNRYINTSRNIELDCEKRAVNKIKKYKLPVNTEEYIQRANAYIFFYTLIKKTRKWYKIESAPYNNKEVWSQMPDYFISNYNKIPKKEEEILLKIL